MLTGGVAFQSPVPSDGEKAQELRQRFPGRRVILTADIPPDFSGPSLSILPTLAGGDGRLPPGLRIRMKRTEAAQQLMLPAGSTPGNDDAQPQPQPAAAEEVQEAGPLRVGSSFREPRFVVPFTEDTAEVVTVFTMVDALCATRAVDGTETIRCKDIGEPIIGVLQRRAPLLVRTANPPPPCVVGIAHAKGLCMAV